MTGEWETLRPVNGRHQSRRQIGWYTIKEPRDFTHYGEYAADYSTITVPAGRYPIYALRDCGRAWHTLLIPMDGQVKSGSWWNQRKPGEPFHYTLSPYQHTIAKALVDGEAPHIELLDGVEARRIDFEFDGKPNFTHGIFVDGVEC
jgi:hypothetical protein